MSAILSRSAPESRCAPEQNRLLAALPTCEYERLAPRLEDMALQAGQLLALPDETISRVYFLRGAIVSLLVPMEDGSAIEGATLGREGMVGLEALLGDGTARVEVVVDIPGRAACMDANAFRDALGRSMSLQRLIQQYTLALLHQIARTAGCNRRHSVRERVARVLLMSHDGVDRQTFHLTHESLGVMLGVRRASVTEAATSLHAAGLITYRRGSMTIVDVNGLRAAACLDYGLSCEAYERLRRSVWD
jgi:CRP-like cAMP-binding protein